MPVAEASREKELKAQVADLKAQLNAASLGRDQLGKDLGAAQKALARNADLERELGTLREALKARDAEISNLNAALGAASATRDRAEQILEAGKQLTAALKVIG